MTNPCQNVQVLIKQSDALLFLQSLPSQSCQLVLTDPPYIISRETGMNKQFERIKNKKEKTETEWAKYKEKLGLSDDSKKNDYIKFGSVLGKKYSIQTNYGEWDSKFCLMYLDKCVKEMYRILNIGGQIILFCDLWKVTVIREILLQNKFKQIRFIEWIKTNPVPINSKRNYLTNAREIALTGTKIKKPTFNSEYDNGIYYFSIPKRLTLPHPTKKSLKLFEELIKKHSNQGDLVIDPFLGSGTTAIACKNLSRNFKGCDLNQLYVTNLQNYLNSS